MENANIVQFEIQDKLHESVLLPEDKEEDLDKSLGSEEAKSKTPAFNRSLVPDAVVTTESPNKDFPNMHRHEGKYNFQGSCERPTIRKGAVNFDLKFETLDLVKMPNT
jgi:hypothetical protein